MAALLQMLTHQLRHLEHVDCGLASENRFQGAVGLDHPLVLGVLQLVLLDVCPQPLGDLGPGIGLEPITSDSAGLGVIGFMKAGLGFRADLVARLAMCLLSR
jgi:hypothetical protein